MRRISFSIFTGMLACASLHAADSAPVIRIIRETIREGHSAAHERVETDWARAARRAKLKTHYIALGSVAGANEVWFIEAHPSFAGVEAAENEVEKAPSIKAEMQSLDTRDGEHRVSSLQMLAIYRKDLSYNTGSVPVGKARYFGVQRFQLRLGKEGDFKKGSAMFKAAHEKIQSKEPWIMYQVIGGAPEGLFLGFTPMESMSALDEAMSHEKALMEAMGPDFAKLMAGSGSVFSSMELSIFGVRSGMSYVSKETEDTDPDFWRPKAAAAKPAAAKPKTGS